MKLTPGNYPGKEISRAPISGNREEPKDTAGLGKLQKMPLQDDKGAEGSPCREPVPPST